MSVRYVEVLHDCDPPDLPEVGTHGEEGQVLARWKCPVCKAHWWLKAVFFRHDRFYWVRITKPSWRWRRAERKRLASLADTSEGTER